MPSPKFFNSPFGYSPRDVYAFLNLQKNIMGKTGESMRMYVAWLKTFIRVKENLSKRKKKCIIYSNSCFGFLSWFWVLDFLDQALIID